MVIGKNERKSAKMKQLKYYMKKNVVTYSILKKIYQAIYLMFSPCGLIYNYVVFPVTAFFRERKIPPFYNGYCELEKLHDVHKNQRCFILATGPSLTVDDINMLRNEITFSMNSMYLTFDKTDWRPTYYLLTDPKVCKKVFHDPKFNKNDCAKEKIILSNKNKEYKGKNIVYIAICWLDHWISYGKKMSTQFRYRPNLLHGMYCAYTSTNDCIMLAAYMGIKEIYLVGADCNYLSKEKYFVATDENKDMSNDMANFTGNSMIRGYQFIKTEMDKLEVKVYNATRGGSLEVFPRVDLDLIIAERNNRC